MTIFFVTKGNMMLFLCIIGCLLRNLDAQVSQGALGGPQSNPESIYFPEDYQYYDVQIPTRRPVNTLVTVTKSDGIALSAANDLDNRFDPKPTEFRPTLGVSQTEINRPGPIQDSGFGSSSKGPNYNYLLNSVTNLGVGLLKNINPADNVVVSPFSVSTLLALIQQGAVGDTQTQLNSAMRMSPEISAASFASVTSDIKSRDQDSILKTANNIYVSRTFSLSPSFKSVAQQKFNSAVTPLNFGNSDVAASEINAWVASKTNNKIKRLISADALNSRTQIVLVNAIYFKGLWEIPFSPSDTVKHSFQLSNGGTKDVSYMHNRDFFKGGVDDMTNAKVVILPFKREQYSLIVILPSQVVGMAETLASLTDTKLLAYQRFRKLDTDLRLPRFTVQSDIDLIPVLKSMGITDMFSERSQLGGIGGPVGQSPQITTAVHSAVLSIDENGGSAAAASAFGAVALSYDDPVRFTVDRPFIAVLWDNKASLPLFIAKVENPQE